jgi:proline iminopeptidase
MKILLFLASLFLATSLFAQSPKVEEGYKDIYGTKLYYKAVGEGEPILIVHGGPGLEHSYFLPHFNELAKKHTLIFFDLRGHGKSDANMDSAHIQLSYFIDDIEAMRKAFGIEKLILLGHSFGGLLAENYAAKYPSNLKALILVSPASHASKYTIEASKTITERTTQQDLIDRQTVMSSPEFKKGDPKAYEKLFRINFRTGFANKGLIESLQLSFPQDYQERSMLLRKMYMENWFYTPGTKFANIFCPTLIIYGEFDAMPKACYEDLQARILRSTLVSIPNCGHFPFIEAKEKFFAETEKFLSGLK